MVRGQSLDIENTLEIGDIEWLGEITRIKNRIII